MASSLAETIGNNFLQCSICLEQHNNPCALPCQHGFCLQCLEELVASSRDKQTLACPFCCKVVKMSKEGVRDLPVHFLVNSLKDAVELDKVDKNPSPETNCCICDESNNKAVVRCIDCKQYLCDSCHTSHRSFKAMETHRVVPMEDILSGKVDIQAEEKTMCEDHQEPIKFYCQDEKRVICQDCVILKACPIEHNRITIDKAAKEKSEDLEELVNKSKEILKRYHDSVKEADVIEKDLEIHSKLAKATLTRVQQQYIELVKKTVNKFKNEIDNIKQIRIKQLDRMKTSLKSTMKEIQKATEHVTHVIHTPYKMEVISSYKTMSTKLETISDCHPDRADKKFGYVKFEAAIPSKISIGQLFNMGKTTNMWKLMGQFRTGDFNKLCGLAIDHNDNIVVCSWDKGVKVFTRSGDVQSTLYDFPGSVDMDVLPDKKYVTVPLNKMQIKICDSKGKQVVNCPITNLNNVPSNANSLAVDSDNKIIVGQVTDTISIHNINGCLISKFETQSKSYRLAATSNKEIVGSFNEGRYIQLMDYNGGNVRIIQPPDEVEVWSPGFVCCGQGEIFVSNTGSGDPTGVYRYTSEGDYLGCVTTQVRTPSGIALSRDGMELFVANYGDDSHIKIFKRP